MRWGFLGIGRVTTRMVEAVRATPGHSLVSAAARHAQKLDVWSTQFEVTETTTDFSRLVASDSIDAVYVALPPSLHAKWATAAMEAGKVVLCEKPLTNDLQQAVDLQESSERLGIALHHATALPHHPRTIAMRDVVRSGQLGQLSRVSIACTFSHVLSRGPDHRTDLSQGGGCLLDLGWYCAFTTLWMTGLKPVSIQAYGKRLGGDGVWISAQAIVVLEQGVIAHWDCGFDAAGRKWMEIAGSDASIVCDDFLRPWDLEKPRFWVHGHDGKARAEIVAAGVHQESKMIESVELEITNSSRESLEMAVETQAILDRWERAIHP